MMRSELNNVLVMMVNVLSHNSTAITNGLVVYYRSKSNNSKNNKQMAANNLNIHNFTYNQTGCFFKGIHNVFYIDFHQNKIEILVTINKTVLMDLCNTGVLYYRDNGLSTLSLSRKVVLVNCHVHNITAKDVSGFPLLNLAFGSKKGSLDIMNSMFYQNKNINSVIVINNTTREFDIAIDNCSFSHNHVLSIIKDFTFVAASVWGHPVTLGIYNTIISSNTHHHGESLILLNSGEFVCSYTVIVNNSYYDSIIELHFSFMAISDYIEISNNHARHVLYSAVVSFAFVLGECIFEATNNTVYSPLGRGISFSKTTKPLCFFQFLETLDSLSNTIIRIEIVDNICTAPIHLIDNDIYSSNCKWFYNYGLVPTDVFYKTMKVTNVSINKKDIGTIPSSIASVQIQLTMNALHMN